MAQPIAQPWTTDAFFAWQDRQPDRYELVGGFPLRMMAGTKNGHDDISTNIIGELRNRLRGTGCRPFTGDGAVETYPGQIRRPDAGVDCGPRDPDGYVAADPRLVAEVLSPSTRDFDSIEKLAEYKAVESLDYILYVEPNRAEVAVWSRGDDRRWERALVEDLGASIDLPSLGIALPLAEIYDGVAFTLPPRPAGRAPDAPA